MLFLNFLLSFLTLTIVGAAVIPEKAGESNAPAYQINTTHPFTLDPLISTNPKGGGVFPPDYPQSQYKYHVRFSTITLTCIFRYKPRIKSNQVDAVLQKSITHYGDPGKQDDLVYKGVARAWDVHNSQENEGVTYLTIRVNTGNPREMTYGHAVNALVGVNRIRMQWPKLDMHCRIHNIFRNRDIDLGDIELFYYPRANPYLVSTM
ncbi:MAG: hypothetical protein Q9221_000029 [Calogaya cf. arnoldii]